MKRLDENETPCVDCQLILRSLRNKILKALSTTCVSEPAPEMRLKPLGMYATPLRGVSFEAKQIPY